MATLQEMQEVEPTFDDQTFTIIGNVWDGLIRSLSDEDKTHLKKIPPFWKDLSTDLQRHFTDISGYLISGVVDGARDIMQHVESDEPYVYPSKDVSDDTE